eukprot:1149937-Rhodomonas_salina.2
MQSVRSLLPDGECEFAGQLWHRSPVVDATLVEKVPAGHSVQAIDPLTVLYFPATHPSHGPPSGPV